MSSAERAACSDKQVCGGTAAQQTYRAEGRVAKHRASSKLARLFLPHTSLMFSDPWGEHVVFVLHEP